MARRIGLRQHVTGLPFVIWLKNRPSRYDDNVIVEVTSDETYDPDFASSFVIEPSILLVRGDLDQDVADYITQFIAKNQGPIEDFWEQKITDGHELVTKIAKVGHFASA